MRADPAVFRRCGVLALCLAPWLVALPDAVAAQGTAADPRLGSGPAPAFGLEQMRRADPLDMRQSLPVTQPDRRPQAVRGTGGEATAPMSAIDWLDALTQAGIARPGAGGAAPFDDSGDIAESALAPEVRTLTLSASDAGAVGLLPASVTGLPTSLWEGAETAALIRRIERLEVDRLPAMQSLLYTLLLAEADPPDASGPQTEDDPLLLARIDKLADLGALDPAMALIERAGQTRSPALFARWFDLSLLSGLESQPCRRIATDPDIAPSQAARIFCMARNSDWDTAALLLETAGALGTLEPSEERLLTRFLHVDLDDGAVPLPPPTEVTPLLFRLSEAIGEPLPTSDLPRAYAYYDLRGRAGWKAALEAAERLARTGALPENRLLGLYSGGRPSASGGIWDRVAALQAFDAAIGAPRPDRALVRETLPPAWEAMQDARLETSFAALYAGRLATYAAEGDAAGRIALRTLLLAPDPTDHLDAISPRTPTEAFLLALARGRPDQVEAPSERARIVARGFSAETELPPRLARLIDDGLLGEAILEAMQLYSFAMEGNVGDTAPAIAAFRALGLEETARAAALQILLLDDRG
ncbi:hypothetical protein PSM7751_00825 [Pseudooceanicola marinus]|uniref:Uncharacterized protein n=1 Tax=Pseudooceanicola marinus TaxID=396013 RepID=A0A1X6YKY6_9RHOB|nr:hypothetical protein [Pseudooceanicola marinus]PJE29323.1 hypothetical protein CVM50_12470 [Pseudooceanicola marinus]SLN24453.1 hypothetical protein PSM7751_00825 [Pseudooceanicola marinus]